MVDQHKRARQLKDGAQGGQLAGGREAVCEKIKQFEDDHRDVQWERGHQVPALM
jgi:hypothetical protein